MYLCYIDESGTSVVPGNTSHFVLAGLSIPIVQWNGGDLHKVDEYLDYNGLRQVPLGTIGRLN
jgi:hypothetical protein